MKASKNKKPDDRINMTVNSEVKRQMNIIAATRVVDPWVIWQEAAISYLEGNGISVELNQSEDRTLAPAKS